MAMSNKELLKNAVPIAGAAIALAVIGWQKMHWAATVGLLLVGLVPLGAYFFLQAIDKRAKHSNK